MRRIPRWSLFTAFVLVLVVGAASSLMITTIRRPFPTVSGQLRISGLRASVSVLRDANGIPNIYADNAEDLFEAQGYVHAQDRFYEMDIRRHITSGRLSEMFGASQLQTDSYIRTMGWRRAAAAELPLLSSATRRYLDAYAAGVNAYLDNNSLTELSLEYSVLKLTGLNYSPEPWTAVDSLSWLKAMAWDLDGNIDEEVSNALVTASMGADRAADLYPAPQLEDQLPIVQGGTVVNGRFEANGANSQGRPAPTGTRVGAKAGQRSGSAGAGGHPGLTRAELIKAGPALEAAAKVRAAIPSLLGRGGADAGIGSNSWVVSGRHTTTGKPLLENDPHLDISIPSIFAQVGLHCRRLSTSCPFDVSGFSFSGMPGVIIGHNNAISWGFTDSYSDVQDFYLEDLRGDSARVGDRYRPLRVRTEKIKVKGETRPRRITVRVSRHGPLLSDVDPQLTSVGQQPRPSAGPGPDTRAGRAGYGVALRWEALIPGRSMDALFGIDAAQNFTQFRSAAALLSGPSQNMVYADTAGNIGYQLPGHFPLRGAGTGDIPAPGWDTAYDWKGTVPFAELPYLRNPSSGYVVTANQTVIGSQYPYKLGSDYSYGWRSQELNDQISSHLPLSPDQAGTLFYDDMMRYAGQLVPALLKVRITDGWVRQGQRTLVGWNYHADADSAAAAYFSIVFHDLLKLTFDDQLPAEHPGPGRGPLVRRGRRAVEPAEQSVVGRQVHEAGRDPGRHPHRDDDRSPQGGHHVDVPRSERVAVGLVARLQLKNQTLGVSGVPRSNGCSIEGTSKSAAHLRWSNALGYNEQDGYQPTVGPSMRMLVDFSDLDASHWINQTGASGHAFNTNYDDQTQLWAHDQLLPFRFSQTSVESAATHRLTLVPTG